MNEKNSRLEEKFKTAVEYHKKNDFEKTEKILIEILELDPDHINANFFLGSLLLQKNEFSKEREFFLKVISLNPNNPDSYNNLGIAMKELGQKTKALTCFQKAIEFNPQHKMAHNNLGIVFKELGKYTDAQNSYEKAIKIDPNNADAYNNLGVLFTEYGDHEKSKKYLQKAIKIQPKFMKPYSNLLFSLCWLEDSKNYLDFTKNYYKVIPSYNRNFTTKKIKENKEILKVGFVSGDFKNHPVAYFFLDTIKNLSNKNLKIFAYNNSNVTDDYTHLLQRNFNKWTNIFNKSDQDIINTIRDDNIDILIDMSGHTKGNKLFLFKNRCAPVQVTWSGWLASTGINEMDYIIADPHVISQEDESKIVEKVYRLKKIWQCMSISNLNPNIFSTEIVKKDSIIFGSFNNTIKIGKNLLKIWSEILKELPNSKLFLKYGSFDMPEIKNIFLKEFLLNGVKEEQIIIEGRSDREEYLKCYNNIDIILDSFPINGGTTNFEASYMGVPILTSFTKNNAWFKSGLSINKNLNMEDWIAENEKDYIHKAIKFSEDKKKLIKLKKYLRNLSLKTSLFDSAKFADDFYEMLLDIKNK